MAVFCKNCGSSMNESARFCSSCGAQMNFAAPPALYTVQTRLIRPRAGRMIAGVCQGLANNYAWDVSWVRVITVLLSIFGGGAGIVAYVVFWVVMPEEPLALPPSTTYVPPSQG
jgi:phage shock protein C